jgi:hypothetical protein
MISLNSLAARRAGMPIAALLMGLAMSSTALSATAAGATAAQGKPPVEELQELDEIRVRGRLTANVVVDAENRFFRLYNKLNKDNRFDVYCEYMRLDPDSMIMQRACLPDFLYNYVPAYASPAFTSGFSGTMPSCGGMNAYSDPDGNTYYVASCLDVANFSAYGGTSRVVNNGNVTWSDPSPRVFTSSGTPEERAEYAATLLRVVKSDAQLLAMANDLIGKWNEMDRVQAHFVKVRDERRAARNAAKAAAKAEKAALRECQRAERESRTREQ